MTAVSGQYGKILIGASVLVECTGWELDRSVELFDYASCATAGAKKRVAGVKDASVTLRGVMDPDDRIEDYLDVGDAVTLKLFYTATKHHLVPVVVESINEGVDIEAGDINRWEITASLNGSWTLAQSGS